VVANLGNRLTLVVVEDTDRVERGGELCVLYVFIMVLRRATLELKQRCTMIRLLGHSQQRATRCVRRQWILVILTQTSLRP
jgi:hypothetical protein